MKKNVVISLFVILILLLCEGQTFAQPKDFERKPPPIPTATIQGRVIDSQTGEGISGAQVIATRWGGDDYYSITTNSNGYYSIPNIRVWRYSSIYTLTASAQGYKSSTDRVWIRPGGIYTVNFSLEPLVPPTAIIKGRVTDVDTGEGIFQAKVTAQSWWWKYTGKWRYETYTDAQGNYEIKNVHTLRTGIYYRLSASKKEYHAQYKTIFIRPAQTYTVDFALIPVRPPVVIKITSPPDGYETREKTLNVTVYYRIHGWQRYRDCDEWDRIGKGKPHFWWFRRTIDLQLDGGVAGTFHIPFWQREGTHTFTVSNYSLGEHVLQSFAYLDVWKKILLAKSNIVHFTYIFDTTPPAISNLIPPDSSIINNSKPEISAIVTDTESGVDPASIQMTLDGQAVTPSYDPTTGKISYTSASALAEGLHNAALSVKDYAKNEASQPWSFTVDTLPPTISDLSPPDGAYTNNPQPEIAVILKDVISGVDFASIILTVDGNTVTHAYDSLTGKVSYTPSVLAEGQHNVAISVKDIAGNQVQISWAFTVDTVLPAITDLSPPEGTLTNNPKISISAIITDVTSGINPVSIILAIDGTQVTHTYDEVTGKVSYTPTDPFSDGYHEIILTVKDRATNTASVTWHFTIDTIPPVVTITLPVGGSLFNYSPITVTGTIDDVEALLLVRGAKAVITDNTFTAEGIILCGGENIIKAEAMDLAGNIGKAFVTVTLERPVVPKQTNFTYDDRGNVLTITDPLGNVTTFTYNPRYDLVISITDSLGHKILYSYDDNGNLIRLTDALGNITSYNYDSSGNLIQLTDSKGNITFYEYDTYGNLVTITDALGNQTTFNYDILGNVLSIIDARGNITSYEYDAMNRLTKIIYPDSTSISYAYDAVGNRTSVSDQNNNSTNYVYDVADRLIEVRDALTNITSYAYDNVGNRIAITDANNHATSYLYDQVNRLIKVVTPTGKETQYAYDGTGNRTATLDANGNTINYMYDANNRLLETDYPDDSEVCFDYDATGKRVGMLDSRGITHYTYDDVNRLTEVFGPGGEDDIRYEYDANGNRISMTNQDEETTLYEYDSLNRLVKVTDPYGKMTTYSYDAVSNLIEMRYPNNTQASYSLDNLNRLLTLTNEGSSGIISRYAYEYNPAGMRTAVTMANGDRIDYGYDALNRLTSEVRTGALAYNYAYSFDVVGNRISLVKDGNATNYTYNDENQLLSWNNGTHSATYAYNNNGNLIQKIENGVTTGYGYDYENRLTNIGYPDSTTSQYSYDGVGKRVQTTENGITTNYLYDGLNAIIERDETGDTIASYVRGLSYGGGIGSIISSKKVQDIRYHYYDGIGSVTNLTDENGLLIQSYQYDAYGNLLTLQAPSPYGFSTKEYLPQSGLIYFGNRYYDPRIGRFITKDIWPANLGFPLSINRYIYCYNNPVNFIDPWGLTPKDPRKMSDQELKDEKKKLHDKAFGSGLTPEEIQRLYALQDEQYRRQGEVISEKTTEAYRKLQDVRDAIPPGEPITGDPYWDALIGAASAATSAIEKAVDAIKDALGK